MFIEMRDGAGAVLGTVVLDEFGTAVLLPDSQLDADTLWAGVRPSVRREDGRRYLLALRDAYPNPPLHAIVRYE